MSPNSQPDCYFAASALAAVVNFPLWKASAIAQAGFNTTGSGVVEKYFVALRPPYKGVLPTMAGMTWARAAIFWGSDSGKEYLIKHGFSQVNIKIVWVVHHFVCSGFAP